MLAQRLQPLLRREGRPVQLRFSAGLLRHQRAAEELDVGREVETGQVPEDGEREHGDGRGRDVAVLVVLVHHGEGCCGVRTEAGFPTRLTRGLVTHSRGNRARTQLQAMGMEAASQFVSGGRSTPGGTGVSSPRWKER